MIRHLSFDFWNTLVSPNPKFSEARTAFLSALTGLSPEDTKAAYLRVKRNVDMLAEVTGTAFSSYNIFRMFLRECNLPLDTDKVWTLYEGLQKLALEYPPMPAPCIVEALKRVQIEGYTIGIVSNTNFISGATLRLVIAEWGITFDSMVFSDEHPWAKPNPNLFSQINFDRRESVHKYEIMHIGDHPICDYDGAVRHGFKAYHVEDLTKLPAHLHSRFVTPVMESTHA